MKASGAPAARVVPTAQHAVKELTLTGSRTRLEFRLAQPVDVRLAEASSVTGGLIFHILQGVPDGSRGARQGRRPRSR